MEIEKKENEQIESGDNGNGTDYNAIDAIKDLKEKSVSKDEYEKLKKEHADLLKAFVNGEQLEKTEVKKPNIDELRKATFKEGITNLEFAENALKLRDALIEDGQEDPFVPQGQKIIATNEDYEAAQRVADVLKECIEYAEGDNQVFTNELQRRTIDVMPIKKQR